jgi:hypothetical protein
MSKNKAIISIGVIALMGSINAKAMAEDFNPDSFLDVKNEITIVNPLVSYAKKNNVNSFFKNTFTGKNVPLSDVLAFGGVFEDPFKKGEVILVKINDYIEQGALKEESYKNKKTYKQLKSSISTVILRQGKTNFYSESIDGLDTINIDTREINNIIKNNKMLKEKDLFKAFVFFHEYAHSKNHQEKSTYDAINAPVKSMSKEYYKKHVLSGENFADSYALLELTKLLVYDKSNKKDVKRIIDNISDKIFKWRLKSSKETSKTKYPDHATMPSLFATKKFIDENFDHMIDFTEEDINKIAASITNRVLNHKAINKHLHSEDDMKEFLKSNSKIKNALSKSTKAVLKEVDAFIMINDNKSYSFNYDSDKKSKILKKSPSIYKY